MVLKSTALLMTSSLTLVSAMTTSANAQVRTETSKILASDGSSSSSFGRSITIDNNIIAVGATFHADLGTFSGAVYLIDATTGAELIKLLPNDGGPWIQFGSALAIDNNILAVGSAVGIYLFDADPSSPNFGAQLSKLLPDDVFIGDQFGLSVSMNNGILAAGSPGHEENGSADNMSGAAYLFDADPLSAGFGTQLIKLRASDADRNDEFGFSVSIDNGIVAIGANRENSEDPFAADTGAVYIFDADPLSATFGDELIKIKADDPERADWFGSSVTMDNGILAVGSPQDDDRGTDSGSTYLFDADPNSPNFGTLLIKLTAFDGQDIDSFGFSIDMNGGLIVIGAWFGETETAFSVGAAYLFDADPLSVDFGTLINKLSPSDGVFGDAFGYSVSIDNGIAAIGAQNDDDQGSSSGSAYIYNTNTLPCPADFTGEGDLNFLDVSAFVKAFSTQNLSADFSGDGILNFLDVSAFVHAFTKGCP